MRIALTGGGTGGHFYPLIAVSEALEDVSKERRLIEPQLFYIGPSVFDPVAISEHDIVYMKSPAGRLRRYRSILNIFDIIKTGWGVIRATIQLYKLYPDVVFSTGGFAAYPTLFAARLLRIPVIIYDADATPGRVSVWSSKFASRIGVAHPDAAAKFPKSARDKIARIGHPIRKEIEAPAREGGYEFLKLENGLPSVFIMGGSQGSMTINNAVLDALPDLVKRYNVIHQAGTAHLDETKRIARLVLEHSSFEQRYRAFGLLNTLALRMAAGIATVVVARAGSGTIFEIASWGIPAILVPIPKDISHDQTENAFSYARSGAAVVIEQHNLTPHILLSEIERIVGDKDLQEKMRGAARAFARPASARKIAVLIIDTALEHESV
ncbi:MAG: UDP diphospho-muramoyl pentapeptide beta-N acetylglucosaminyl transferase [Parcubacteria group bacterium GW2011_GWA2_51_10]|nr:MAG: UDP diphospho-muramoyl pentapeptide beta-N acetylglucosaminyl transferase [Parcubacteria group bacterium GW2011_GWA2_51_10]